MIHQHIVDAVEAEIQQAGHHRFCALLKQEFFQVVVAERRELDIDLPDEGQIPVISLSASGMEPNPGFKLTPTMIDRIFYAILYGDLLMLLANQCRPYEIEPLRSRWM